MFRRFLFAAAVPLLAVSASAQFRWETVDKLGVAIRVHDDLHAIPTKFKDDDPHLVAHYRPKDEGDYIHGKYGAYHWDLLVFSFAKDPQDGPVTGIQIEGGENLPEEIKVEIRGMMKDRRAKDFEDFVRDKDPRNTDTRVFNYEGRKKRGSSKRPDYFWWEYTDTERARWSVGDDSFIIWYQYAAVYQFDDKQVALVCIVPVMRGKKPDRKYDKIAKEMLTSLTVNESAEEEDLTDEKRDKYADTPERKKELELLKDNIRDFENWDYFTSPSYLIAFSWDKKDHRDKRPAYNFAFMMAEKLEDIRELYVEHYPPHEKMEEHYSLIRVCSDYEEFLKYGEMSPGVVGWFSPRTKELCVFRDVDNIFAKGDDETLAVVYHEAWHQYSDQYWPEVELHRWFDEGLAEFFGTWRKKGSSWKYVYHEGRYDSVRSQLRNNAIIRSDKIVGWPLSKFYGARAPDHYAQAWVMVDFLKRGEEKLRDKWDPSWSQILPTYAKICLEEKDAEKAAEKALENVDTDAFEAAWKEWFDKDYIRRD